MHFNVNLCRQNNTYLNVNSINRSIQNKTNSNGVNKKRNRDKVTFSSRGKMLNIIENLTKQKEAIRKNKSSLIVNTLENGGDMESIEGQLDNYEDQLKNIDKQIEQITAQEAKKAVDQSKVKKIKTGEKNKNEESDNIEKLSKIASATDDIKKAEAVSSVKRKTDGEINVESAEIKSGEIRIDKLESRGLDKTIKIKVKDLINNEKNVLEKKSEIVSDLQDKSRNTGLSQYKKIADAMNKLEDISDNKTETTNSKEKLTNRSQSNSTIMRETVEDTSSLSYKEVQEK